MTKAQAVSKASNEYHAMVARGLSHRRAFALAQAMVKGLLSQK